MWWSHQGEGSLKTQCVELFRLDRKCATLKCAFFLLWMKVLHYCSSMPREFSSFTVTHAHLWPWPTGPNWWTAVCVAGLPPGRCGLGTVRVGQGVYYSLAGSLDALDLPRLLPSSTAPAAHPPLSYRPAGTTQHKAAESTCRALNHLYRQACGNSQMTWWLHS